MLRGGSRHLSLAFFPEAGGQSSDKGKIGDIEVIKVEEEGDILYHYTKTPLIVNNSYQCKLDFEERLDKMRCHTAEHILSGILHKLYGVENTGFHLGAAEVTFDTSLVMSKEELKAVERMANEAVMRNLRVSEYYPTAEELPTLTYRSKLDLTENVRIVYIEDTDACACCAPHVRTTGEIGLIKIVDSVKHKGGSRITMLAGMRAFDYIQRIVSEAGSVSVLLCAPPTEISVETARLYESKNELCARLLAKDRELASVYARLIPATDSSFVSVYPTLDTDALREIANSVGDRVGGALVLLSGEDGSYKYVIRYSGDDFKSVIACANTALNGKGGGRAPMAQGNFAESLDRIKEHFEK